MAAVCIALLAVLTVRATDVICPEWAASEKWNPLSSEIRTGEAAYHVCAPTSSTINKSCCYLVSLTVMQTDSCPRNCQL